MTFLAGKPPAGRVAELDPERSPGRRVQRGGPVGVPLLPGGLRLSKLSERLLREDARRRRDDAELEHGHEARRAGARLEPMRTSVRVQRRGDDPACRSGLLLRVCRTARRPAPARSAGDRRRRRRPGGVTRRRPSARMAMPGRAPGSSASRRSSFRRACRRTRREQGGLRGVRRHGTARRRDVDDEAFLDVRGVRRLSGTPGEVAA